MLVPLYARDIAAVAGGLLVLAVWSSAIGALVVTRAVGSRLTRMADKIVTIAFRVLNEHIPDYGRRDRVMSFQAAAILVAQLAAWLGTAFVGFTLLLWPFEHDRGVGRPSPRPDPRCSPSGSTCRPGPRPR